MRRPSTRMVQAPHWPRSHPFLVPGRSSRSRNRSSSVTRGSSSDNVPADAVDGETEWEIHAGLRSVYGRVESRQRGPVAADRGVGAPCQAGCWSPYSRHPPVTREGERKSNGRVDQQKLSASRAPMPCATASACWKRPRPCSRPAAARRASRRWRGMPASASARSIATSRPARRCYEAVYRREVEQLGELAEQLQERARTGRGAAALAARQCPIRRDQEGHGGGAGAGRRTARASCMPIRSTA